MSGFRIEQHCSIQ